MSKEKILIGTLVLNEMEWLPKLIEQHIEWPGLCKWVFVESADRVFAKTNPNLVSNSGLSVDGTSEFLADISSRCDNIVYIPFGFSENQDIAEGKCAARQQYLNVASNEKPDFVVIVDGDEFYMKDDQSTINKLLVNSDSNSRHFCFEFTHIWRPPSISDQPLFQYEVCGGFWAMRHTKAFRWVEGVSYTESHQKPIYIDGGDDMIMFNSPHCIHMAFASKIDDRKATHDYYKARGEGVTDKRGWYVDSRAAFESWQPGNRLPRGSDVRSYRGPIPECFQ